MPKLLRITCLALTTLLTACGSDTDSNAAPSLEYELIVMAIRDSEFLNIPSGTLIIEETSTFGDIVEIHVKEYGMSEREALETMLPDQGLPWATPQEFEAMRDAYFDLNADPVPIDIVQLQSFRESIAISHQEYIEPFIEGSPASGWEEFYAKFPGAAGYLRLSRVAFDDANSVALFHVDYGCGPLCGVGVYLLFRREDSGWVTAGETIDWMS